MSQQQSLRVSKLAIRMMKDDRGSFGEHTTRFGASARREKKIMLQEEVPKCECEATIRVALAAQWLWESA